MMSYSGPSSESSTVGHVFKPDTVLSDGPHLSGGLPRAISTDKLHKLLQRVLSRVVVVANGWVGEVGARLLNDGGRREVQGRG